MISDGLPFAVALETAEAMTIRTTTKIERHRDINVSPLSQIRRIVGLHWPLRQDPRVIVPGYASW